MRPAEKTAQVTHLRRLINRLLDPEHEGTAGTLKTSAAVRRASSRGGTEWRAGRAGGSRPVRRAGEEPGWFRQQVQIRLEDDAPYGTHRSADARRHGGLSDVKIRFRNLVVQTL